MLLFWCISLLQSSIAINFANRNKAEEYYNHGMYLASRGDFTDALSFLRAAVRLDPEEVNYIHDLGVTEAQLGHFSLAEKRFLASLHLDPTFQDATTNLQRVQLDMRARNIVSTQSCASSQRHLVATIPSISHRDITNHLQHPFIIRNFTLSMHWEVHDVLSRILASHADAKTDFYPQNMLTIPTKVFFLSLSSAWEQLKHPDGLFSDIDASSEGTYFQWNLDAIEWASVMSLLNASFPLPLYNAEWLACLQDSAKDSFMKQTHWNMLLVGEKSSGMFNHVDTLHTASFQVQLQGAKKWHICAPQNTEFMYLPGDVDAFHPDYEKYPLFTSASCIESTVHAGDLIYYPHDYWHQTINEELSVALSSTVLTDSCYNSVVSVLDAECINSKKYKFSEALCRDLLSCTEQWHNMFAHIDT